MTDTAQTWRGALGRAKTLEFQEYALAIVVVLLFIAGAILKPDTFPTWDNIRNMLTQSSVVGVLAIGMTFVIATAGIDLSVGSMVAAAGVFGGIMVGTDGTSSLVFILAAILFATFLGTCNATAIAYGRVVPFIATLAMFSIARGLALLLNDKLPVSLLDLNGGSFGDPRPFSLLWFGVGRIFGIPVSVFVFLAIAILGWIVLNRTRYGRYVIAVGGNREAARIAGVPVRRIIFSVYVLSGFLAGISTVLLCARLGSASPVSGNLYELDAIGAVVIGGTSLAGGRASIVGTFLGVLTFALIFSLMTQLNMSTEIQQVTKGLRDDEMFLTGVGGSQDAMQQIKEGGLYRATFLYNPNMAASAVNMARLIGLDEGFSELVPPEVPRQVVVPAAVVTKDNVEEYEQYAFD
jgi:ribose transport system permease protein